MTITACQEWSPAEKAAANTIRGELERLHALDPSSARLLESLAFELARVAHADCDICASETSEMEQILMRLAELPPAQAILSVEIAKQRAKLIGCAGTYSVSRSLRRQTDPQQRLDLLHALVDVASADGLVCAHEIEAIECIAAELGFPRSMARELLAKRSCLRA